MNINDFIYQVIMMVVGILIYVELIRPLLVNMVNHLIINKWKQHKEVCAKLMKTRGAEWAWGMYGTGAYTLNALQSWVDPLWKGPRSPFQQGIIQALEDIRHVDRLKKEYEQSNVIEKDCTDD